MQDIASHRATYADLLAAPPHLVCEILDGRLVTQPRPAPRHARAGARLGTVLGAPFDLGVAGPGGWLILYEPELHFGDAVVVPDFAGWRRERMPQLPETAWFEIAPDWICEVLSPSTARYDKGIKRDLYAAQSVRYLWHVDPVAQILEAFELTGDGWMLRGTFRDEHQVDAPPFAAVPFKLGLLWEGP